MHIRWVQELGKVMVTQWALQAICTSGRDLGGNIAPLLRPHSVMFVGHSESFHHAADLFRSREKAVYELARQPAKG